jgi:fumarate reductase flavoprotein subunit
MGVDRALQPVGGVTFGPYITRVLYDSALKRQIPIRTHSKVTELLQRPDGLMRGVVVQDRRGGSYTVEARAIVLASGGFGASPEKIGRLKPELANFSNTNQPGATGDALDFAERLGIEMVDLDQIQIHPTMAVGAKTLITEAMRGAGGIMVNREGKRFVDEMTTRDKGSAAVLAQPGKTAFVVFDQALKDSMELVEGYFHIHLVREGNTPEELAGRIGANPANLRQTIETYTAIRRPRRMPSSAARPCRARWPRRSSMRSRSGPAFTSPWGACASIRAPR